MLKQATKIIALILLSVGVYYTSAVAQQNPVAQNPQVAMSQRTDSETVKQEVKAQTQVQAPAPQAAPVKYDIKTITEIPDGHRMPKDQFLKDTQYFSNQDIADPNLIFRLRLPKDWISRLDTNDYSGKMNSNFLTDLSRYFGPPIGDLRPFVTVQAKLLDDEYFAEDWFKSMALTSGYNLRAVKVISYKEIEAIYTSLEGNDAYAIHARVIISGDMLFFVKFAVPVSHFDQFADLQTHTIDSFELKEPSTADVESLKDFSLLDAGYFHFPSSWYIKNVNFSTLDRLSVELHRVEEASRITFGQIFVRAIKKKQGVSLQLEGQNIVNEIERKEWKLEKLKERSRVIPPTGFEGGLVEIYDVQVKPHTLDQELWFSYFETNNYYIFVSMYTPMREISFADWAKNKAVFYLVLRNFKLPKE